MKGTFIQDLDGKLIEVTDLKAAIEQAKMFVGFSEKATHEYERKLKLYWENILINLEKLAIKNPKLLQ